MRIFVVTIASAVTMGGLFLFENYKPPAPEQNYAKIVSELRRSTASTPTATTSPIKTLTKKSQPAKKSASIITPSPSPIVSGSPDSTNSPQAAPSPSTTSVAHIYYTSSASQAKYYYCDTDSDWKNLSKANLKQFPSPEELQKSYPNRTLHEPCK